eukprot:2989172-Lingulodinium_polyedra.AAC.1
MTSVAMPAAPSNLTGSSSGMARSRRLRSGTSRRQWSSPSSWSEPMESSSCSDLGNAPREESSRAR